MFDLAGAAAITSSFGYTVQYWGDLYYWKYSGGSFQEDNCLTAMACRRGQATS